MENGGSGSHRKVLYDDSHSLHLLILILGVGSTKPNEEGDEDPEKDNDWKQLLNEDDGVYSLKPWEEVVEMKANKTNIALACREIMRQAWSEYYII